MAEPRGYTLYVGPSRLGPEPIIVIATVSSHNSKTGDMMQTYILLRHVAPMEAVRTTQDATICGDCRHRGTDDTTRSCYVSIAVGGPAAVWKAYRRGLYPWADSRSVFTNQYVRVGAYGDPAALPYTFWRRALSHASGWTGYTHQWRTCAPGFKKILMASTDDEKETRRAQSRGWRTYRARGIGTPLLASEFQCPAADEAGHRVQCRRCLLCRGLSSPAKSVSIELHGQQFKGTRGEEWIARRDSLGLLRASLEAGDTIPWHGSAQDVSRIRFALSMWYRRRSETWRLMVSKVRDGLYDLRLR